MTRPNQPLQRSSPQVYTLSVQIVLKPGVSCHIGFPTEVTPGARFKPLSFARQEFFPLLDIIFGNTHLFRWLYLSK